MYGDIWYRVLSSLRFLVFILRGGSFCKVLNGRAIRFEIRFGFRKSFFGY